MELNGKEALAELIAAAKNGNDDAFEALVKEYKPMIDSLIHRFSLDARDAFPRHISAFTVPYPLTTLDRTVLPSVFMPRSALRDRLSICREGRIEAPRVT